MQSLQSSALGSSLTNDQLDTLEKGFIDAQARFPKITAFREADRTSLATLFTNNNITGTIATDISTLANGLVDNYKSGIDAKIAALSVSDAVKASLKKLTDSINSLSNDIRLTTQFVSWYTSKRPNICTTTDSSNNQYVAGTISFKYPSTPVKTPVVETCSGAVLSEHFCSGLEYTPDAAHDKTRNCEFGCSNGACLKGTIGIVNIVSAASASGTVMTDVKQNQTFYLKASPTRAAQATATSDADGKKATIVSGGFGYASAPTAPPTVTITGGTCTTKPTARATVREGEVTEVKLIGGNCTVAPTIAIAAPPLTAANTTIYAVIDSPSFTSGKCTLTTKSQPVVTSGADLYFGPILCNTTENHTLTFNLTDNNTTIGSVSKTINIGGVSMKNFEITAPTAVAAGNDFSIKVKTIGTNDLPITDYTGDFFIIVDGDDEATFPQGAQKMNGQSEISIDHIKFSKGGTIKITIRGEGVSDTAEKTIVVTGADISIKAGAATSTNSYGKELTANSGDTITYKWEGTNGTTGDTTYTSVKASGGNCGSGQWSTGNGLTGTFTQTLQPANK